MLDRGGVPGARFRVEPPITDRTMLVRERLLDRLRSRWFAPVTVVSAPAGYGKTTLLAQAMATNAAAAMGIDCWLTCEPEMVTASSVGEGLCRAVEAALPRPSERDPANVARVVVEALWRRSPQQVAVVLDDVHEIPARSEAALLLETIVASLPTNGHVVLAGRRPPALPLARLEVEGRLVRIDQDDLAFTDAEVAAFATLRGVSGSTLAACGGWPALAELYASASSEVAGEYLGQEVLPQLPADRRRALGLLAHIGPFDDEVARAVLGTELDLANLMVGVPLVTVVADGEWCLHSLWTSWLERDVTQAEVTEARRRAGLALLRRSRVDAAVRLLIEAEAWQEVAQAMLEALGVARPPVAHDVLAEWHAQLPTEVRDQPIGRLLAAVLATERDPETTWQGLWDCAATFRAADHIAGELACLVQLGQMAWWAEDTDGLAEVAHRGFELEAEGSEEVVPLACLARALLYDIANDSRQMLAELDRITPGSLNAAWWGIVTWTRAIGLLELGLAPEALDAANRALAHAEFLHAPLAQTTRLQALWYQGHTTEVLDAFPDVLRTIRDSGYQSHTALVASQCSAVHALSGRKDQAVGYLAQARAAATAVSDSPLVDVNLSVAEAAVAVVEGDEDNAAAVLAAHVDRWPVRQGMSAAPQQRHLALFYVLVPATRSVWDAADLGPPWAFGRGLARAVAAVRQGQPLPAATPPLHDAALVQAHLPPPWVAELGVAALAAGRQDAWNLLDATWPVTRPTVAELTRHDSSPLRAAARDAVGRLAAPPGRQLELRLLGPVELRTDETLIQTTEWRRERVRSLLAYLVLHETVSRSRAADDLWPRLDQEAQSRNLRVTLTYLLRVLEPDRGRRDASFFVRQHGNNLTLHPGEWLTVDLWDFDAACARAHDADRQGDPSAVLHHALQAVARWRSEPDELAAEAWAIAPLEQRRARFTATATRAGELLLAQGDTDQAQALAERGLAIDPWHEAAHRLVVATHRARSEDLAARRALQRYRDAIGELGLSPDEATLMMERLLDSLPPQPRP